MIERANVPGHGQGVVLELHGGVVEAIGETPGNVGSIVSRHGNFLPCCCWSRQAGYSSVGIEHLTVELCSYQMVPGWIPGGRICTDLSFGCSAGSNILIFHSQVVRTSGKQMFQKSLAPVRVSHGAFHGFGSVPFDPFVRLFLIFYVSFLRHLRALGSSPAFAKQLSHRQQRHLDTTHHAHLADAVGIALVLAKGVGRHGIFWAWQSLGSLKT